MSCQTQPEEGMWIPPVPSNGLTRILVRMNCQDLILNGEPYPPGPPWYVHVWGSCSPTDCDWGEIGGKRLNTGPIYAMYDHGFSEVHVYAQVVQTDPEILWIAAATHFKDDSGRADYVEENWFRREGAAPERHAVPATLAHASRLDLDPTGPSVSRIARGEPRPIPKAVPPPTPR